MIASSGRKTQFWTAVAVAAAFQAHAAAAQTAAVAQFRVTEDAIDAPLDGKIGDASRGRRIVLDREGGNCLICHRVPEPAERFQGEVGPDLEGVAGRLSVAQMRLRMVDQSRLNPATIMPPYHRVDNLKRVPSRFFGRPALQSQEIEDVLAYLATLRG